MSVDGTCDKCGRFVCSCPTLGKDIAVAAMAAPYLAAGVAVAGLLPVLPLVGGYFAFRSLVWNKRNYKSVEEAPPEKPVKKKKKKRS